jgi:glycosyltransferase involved in cell wall biosynthesis
VRLAFLSPIPPAPTGIADYAAEVLALLAPSHEIHVFHAQGAVDPQALPEGVRVHHASGFLNRHRAQPFDLVVYQMGNGPAHDFLYEPMIAVPGLLVLHDLVLHHARARMFLGSPEAVAYASDAASSGKRDAARAVLARYAQEVAYAYPEAAGRLDQAHLNTTGILLPYAYPLFRLPVEASRLVAVHNAFMAEAVRDEVADAAVAAIPMAASAVPVPPEAVASLRERLGLRPGDFVVGSFGLLTSEKGIETVARSVARAAVHRADLRLLLVGPIPDRPALAALLERHGIAARTVIAGRVPLWTLPAHMEAADMVVNLRYPTARETSAALLRLVAQGRPTVISDLEHLADIPKDAVWRADPTDEEGEVTRAILRLAASPRLRLGLSQAARRFAAREHSPERMREGYNAAIDRAARSPAPVPRAEWPAHWQPEAARNVPPLPVSNPPT